MTIEELKQFVESNKDNYGIQLKRHHHEIYSKIDLAYSFDTFGQKLYHFVYGSAFGKCEVCGKQCKFDGIHKGYRKRCSYVCMGKSKYENSHEQRNCVICGKSFEIYKNREKTTCSYDCLLGLNRSEEVTKKRLITLKQTMMKKYGVGHSSQLPDFVEKLKKTKLLRYGDENYVNAEKAKKTKLEKYGSENYINIEKAKETRLIKYGDENYNNRPKFRETNIKRYGVAYPIQLESMQNKRKDTCNLVYGHDYPTQSNVVRSKTTNTNLGKYGVPYIMMNDDIKRKSVENARRYYYSQIISSPKLLQYIIPLFTEQDFINTFRDNKYKFQCKKCNQIFDDHIDGGHVPRCWDCY